MTMSKKEIRVNEIDLQNLKKKKRKKLLCWLAIDLSIAFIIFSLLLYKPSKYNPNTIKKSDEVSPYITKLSSEIYNKSQLNKPFEIVITLEALNEIINEADWPMESQGIMLYAPAALINPEVVTLMGTSEFQGVEFIITIELNATINEKGLINTNVSKVKIGALNITPLAKMTAKKMYSERLAAIGDIDIYSWQTKIAASLLNDEAFDPVFEVEGKKVRIEKIILETEKITAYLVPVKK
jgi:uncharacterized protein YpmS